MQIQSTCVSSEMINLKNKNILITGASQGLGAVCASKFSEMGAKLVICARSKEKLDIVHKNCTNPDKHIVIPVDLTVKDNISSFVEQALGHLLPIHAVLHVAGGGLGLREPLLSMDELQRLFALNVGVAAEINRYIAPAMEKQGFGNLVHVASIAATESTGSVGYNTVKAALSGYVRSLGNEMSRSNVIVNGILAGGFYTPDNAMGRLQKQKPEAYERFIKERLPRGKMGKAEELVPLLAFLCSDSASMMGGCMVPIDAGEGKAYVT